MNKNFESFKEFYSTIKFKFNIVCFSETWVGDISFRKNPNFQLSDCKVLHQTRKNRKRGRVCVFVHENLSYKLKEDLSINCDAFSLSLLKYQVLNLKTLFSILSTGHLTVI